MMNTKVNNNNDKISPSTTILLDSGISLRECTTTGSLLQINNCFEEDLDCIQYDQYEQKHKNVEFGKPIKSFDSLESSLTTIDEKGYVKKKIIECGVGAELHEGCTVSIAYVGYWENVTEPFDMATVQKPLKVDLKDNGLLPGMEIAVKTMLVGEMSLYLFAYEVMFGIMGNPPKIKPKSKCVYYIKLVRSILTPEDGDIQYSEPNMFERVRKEVKYLYLSGFQSYKTKNYPCAIQLFRKAVNMLDRCRLADEKEQTMQEKLLLRLYTNLAICYNDSKQPLKACTVCNEINNLSNIWHNGKALYQNAKALRMIGEFKAAEKKLRQALKLCPDNEQIQEEFNLLLATQNSFSKYTLISDDGNRDVISELFKSEIHNIIKAFKENHDIKMFTLPNGLSKAEIAYVIEVCKEYQVFYNKVQNKLALDKIYEKYDGGNDNSDYIGPDY